jgi:hypothetical protein
MQTQADRMGSMGSAALGDFFACNPVVHELVAWFVDMTA